MKYILFDLDGTILNTNKLVVESFKHTFRKHLKREIPEEELYPYFGHPLVKIMELFDPNQVNEMLTTYREFNLEKHDQLTTLFPGVSSTLEELHKQGAKMAIVSSKIKRMVNRGLQLFSLERYFDTIVAFEDTEAHKPNAAPINKALEHIGPCVKNEVLMVGDSPFDILCAANAGVRSAAVKWTVHGIEELQGHNPDFVLHDFSELLKLTRS